MDDKFDFGENLQVDLAHLMIADTEFLSLCIRRGIHPDHFSSGIVGNIISLAIDYHRQYGMAPGFDTLGQLLYEELGRGLRFHQDDADFYVATLAAITQADNGHRDALLDRLDTFVKARIVYNLTNALLALRDRKRQPEPDYGLGLARDAYQEAIMLTGTQVVESILDADETLDYGETVCKFNIPVIDRGLGGGFKVGNFGVILGYTNIGKSWCAVHLAKMTARLGNTSLLIDLERANKIVKLRLRMCLTGMTRDELKIKANEAQQIIGISMVKRSNITLLNDDEKAMQVDALPSILDDVKEKYGTRPRMVIIDSADDLDSPGGERFKWKIDKSTAIYTWLKNYAKNVENDVCIMTTTQAQRRGETREWLTAGTVGDDINKVRKATIGLSLNALPKEVAKGYLRFFLFKNADGPVGAKAWAKNGYHIGQLFTKAGPYDRLMYEELIKLAKAKTPKNH